jgi:RHH-type proline utilization regulon transcriptional repressor/proline dehydrogenase/delta 1-pyrroline-5-carboxylate dehydrogenase
MSVSASGRVETPVAARIREIGRDLIAAEQGGPRPWNRAWWDDRLMSVAMADPATKVQLFRFVDALPALHGPDTIRRHLIEYLDEAGDDVPGLIRKPLDWLPDGPRFDRLLAWTARKGAHHMASRFIAGDSAQHVLPAILRMRHNHRAFTVDMLGEAILSDPEADAYQAECLRLLDGLTRGLEAEPTIPQIDRDDRGPLPRVNLSLKLTSLAPRFDPLYTDASKRDALNRLRPVLRRAREVGAYVHVDMEFYAVKDLTLELFREVLMEPEFRDWPDAGIVIQAYLKDALGDLEMLRDWAARRGAPVTIRLVKGAYWDFETTHCRQVGWPVPVFEHKPDTDANYERCSRLLLESREHLRPAFGSHNVRSISNVLATAESLRMPPGAFELQMLYGMGGALEQALVDRGYRVRIYTPVGQMLPGMAYLVRRLLENTSNDSFLRASRLDNRPASLLLSDPAEEPSPMSRTDRRDARTPSGKLPPFANEPPTDFSRAENREAMARAIAEVRSKLGRFHSHLAFAGANGVGASGASKPDAAQHIISTDPCDPSVVVGFVAKASAQDAESAVSRAQEALDGWAGTPARERAAVLLRAAALMRKQKFELAAWMLVETAKPWRESDADVAEAIDFCEFYAREMIQRAEPEAHDVPGETNRIDYLPRGVAVVIPPWNFPLAIPCGMTAAALVAGNPVLLKPAEQSPIIAWHLARIFHEAGLPPNVLQYVPGTGEEVGQALVNHDHVALIAFTGSRDVGLLINRQAADTKPTQHHVKRVIAEMGGKNALIIDSDADLDEAVVGVLASAFGYSGQKCSACSRVIVIGGVYDAFLKRLAEAAQTLPIGPADDPATAVNPLIDADATDRFHRYAQIARSEGRVIVERKVPPELAGRSGQYVGPIIVADVDPKARIAQEEVFGPILAVLKPVADLDEALRVAHATPYALTGGLYSRSPAHVDAVRQRLRVGNVYINRPITGALVNRQPFGGFKLSGVGSKAGGSTYLDEFLLTRVVTENTLRRGFAPEEPQAGVATVAAGGPA